MYSVVQEKSSAPRGKRPWILHLVVRGVINYGRELNPKISENEIWMKIREEFSTALLTFSKNLLAKQTPQGNRRAQTEKKIKKELGQFMSNRQCFFKSWAENLPLLSHLSLLCEAQG